MKFFKLLIGIFVLFLAVSMQFWFGIWGFYANFVFAALIAFAFLFNIREFVFLLLLGTFIINWQPAVSRDILAFALIPLLISAAHSRFHWETYIGSGVSVILGITLFYLAIAPGMVVHSFGGFIIDLALSVVFGELIVWGMISL